MGYFEDSWSSLKAAFNSGITWIDDTDYQLVKNPSDISVLDTYDIETDNTWKCDTRHIYSVATSEKGVSGPLTLYRNDIMIGLRSTDSSGVFEGDFNYNPNHSAYYSVTYVNPQGREKNIVRRGIIYGGDKEHGTVYASVYPAEAGTYRITINRVLTAGNCDTPSRQNPNFYSYEVEVVPPEDESEIPFGVDPEDIAGLRAAYDEQKANNNDDSEVEETSIGKFVAIVGVITAITFVLLGGTKTDDGL
jgi:hypothetical protein